MFWFTSLGFFVMILVTAALYFYFFIKRREVFMRFWGFAWIVYSCSNLCQVFFTRTNIDLFIELRNMIDMFHLLLLLSGSYAFIHMRMPTYWYKFSLYLLVLEIVCIIYGFQALSFYLPIFIYQMILTGFICYNMLRATPRKLGITAAAIFFIWGMSVSVIHIIRVMTDAGMMGTSSTGFALYLTEMLLSYIVNLCILVIYILYNYSNNLLVDSLYKTIVENSKDAIFYYTLKPHGKFQYMSPSIKELTGLPQETFYNDPDAFFHLTDENHGNDLRKIFSADASESESCIVKMTDKKGGDFWGEFSCSVIYDADGETSAIVGSMRDITNVKSTELEQIRAAKDRNMLFSYISHELRSPITSISGYLTALNDGTMSSEEEKSEAFEIISDNTVRLKK